MSVRHFLHLDTIHVPYEIYAPTLLDSTYIFKTFRTNLNSNPVSQASVRPCAMLDTCQAQMVPPSTPPKAYAPAIEQPFKIFCDECTPHHFDSSASNADFPDSNNENNPGAAASKTFSKLTPFFETPRPVERAPLTDITQEAVSRPRSLSAALAEIAKLEDELGASKKQNQELKGDIVAYQDALHQADVDTYLWEG